MNGELEMKLLYLTTTSNTVNAFLIPHMKMLIDEGHKVDVAFNIEQEVKHEIKGMGCKVHQLPLQRSPLSKDNFRAYKMLKKIILTEQYDLVHTHTPVASAIVRLACKNLKNVRVFYTAHGFHFYKGAPLINWLVYYPVEKLLARYTDVLITINKEDYARAKNKFRAKKVEYVPGVGLNTDKFANIKVDKKAKREELGIPEAAVVLLSVGELNKNKNHETVIKAVAQLNIPNIYYVICGEGELRTYLEEMAASLGIVDRIKLLGYRTDVSEIYQVADIFVFPSYREGLSVALMEAMASGLPVVCSDIRGNNNLIKDGKGGYLIAPKDVDGFAEAIGKILQMSSAEQLGTENQNTIRNFGIDSVLKSLLDIYKCH